MADFKAEWLNQFVRENGARSVVELGCGDGNQLSLAQYPEYVGLDVSREAISRCRERFKGDDDKRFFCSSDLTLERERELASDLALSLDVIYHLVEDDVFESYVAQLFRLGRRWVIIYSSDFDGGRSAPHVRHRRFTEHVAETQPGWRLVERIPNPHPFDPNDPERTSHADFFVYERRS